jgi:hypothetical protein
VQGAAVRDVVPARHLVAAGAGSCPRAQRCPT